MPSIKEVVGHAMALHQKGDEDGAAAVFEKLLKAKPEEPMALEYLGLRAIKKRDYKTAVSLLRQAAGLPNCRPAVRLQLGHALRDSGQLSDAADSYRRYVTDSSDPAGAVTLAEVLFDLDRMQEAESILRQAVNWKQGHVKALCLLARTCDVLQKPSDAEKFRTAALESEEDGKLTALMKASVHLDLGEPDQAYEIAKDAANCLYGDDLITAADGLDLSALPALQGTSPSGMGVPLIIASGDPAYVQRFAPDLIRSVNAQSTGTDIHIHVIIPDADGAPPALPNDLPVHTMTWENEPNATRVTFTTRRFLRAASFMRTMDRPLILIDMDSVVKKDVAAAKTSLPDFDVALRYQAEEILLPQRVCGGFLTLMPTSGALAFIDMVAAYILHFENNGSALWCLDQMALLAAHCSFSANDSPRLIQIVEVPERFVDWRRHAADSVLWTTKGVRKALPK